MIKGIIKIGDKVKFKKEYLDKIIEQGFIMDKPSYYGILTVTEIGYDEKEWVKLDLFHNEGNWYTIEDNFSIITRTKT